MSEHKCEGRIWAGMHFHICNKTARYEHKGKWYCKRHHPPTQQAKRDARSKKFREEFEARQQASREAEKARAEMQRRAAAYDGLVAQRAALRAELKEATEAINDPAVNNLRTLPESIRVLCAQRDALLAALEEIHQATMKNKVVIAKYIGINFLAAIAIRKAKEGK